MAEAAPDTRRAEALAAALPPLLVEAERVAASVAPGIHGRRRVGQGESFWQFRPFVPGDTSARIDWRQSGKSDRAYVRETEWEAAQTVRLWRDASPSMAWRSSAALPDKRDRAGLLLLALASLLLRGGERVSLLGGDMRPASGRGGLERLAGALARDADAGELPAGRTVARHATIVLFGDFLAPLDTIRAAVGQLAGTPTRGHMLQVLDPAEIDLPYTGRVRFRGLEAEPEQLVANVGALRAAYADRLAEQQSALAAMARASGWSFAVHRTDHPPATALLALYAALAPGLAA